MTRITDTARNAVHAAWLVGEYVEAERQRDYLGRLRAPTDQPLVTAAGPAVLRDWRIVELSDRRLVRLGSATGHSWFTHPDFAEREIRVDVPADLGDNPGPDEVALKVIEQREGAIAREPDPEAPWREAKATRIPSRQVAVFYRCRLLSVGSFGKAQAADARAVARRTRRQSPAYRAEQAAKAERATQRRRWLAGELVELPE